VKDDIYLCRDIEAHCHSVSSTIREYQSHVVRSAFNLRENNQLGVEVVYEPDSRLAEGLIVGHIEHERKARLMRFEQMLQEKYEALDDEQFQAIVRCRRCGSKEVSWEEKQTRSADEGATVFCVCTICKNRWVLR
jgi:transcription elongation factor S-II